MATIKAGTYKFNETIIEPTFEGTFNLPTKVVLELSSSDIIALNNNLSSSGLSIVVQDYLITATYDSWKFTKEISGSTESYGEEYYIVGFNKKSFNVEPYDEILNNIGDSYSNGSEVIHTLFSTGVDPNFTRFTITEDTEVSTEYYEWFTSNTKLYKEPTTTDYLQELINQRKTLANNLVEKGVEASEDEKFNTLVPKVLDIETGVDNSEEIYTELLNMTFGEDSLITFTIDGTEYQAVEGMTWEEWVNSDYNTYGFIKTSLGNPYIANPYIENVYSAVYYINIPVTPSDTIISNENYVYGRLPGGSN